MRSIGAATGVLLWAALLSPRAEAVETSSTATISAEADRESDMFGSPDDGDRDDTIFGTSVSEPPSTAAERRDEEVLESGGGALDRLRAAVSEKNDVLAIGGLLWMQAQWETLRSGAPKTFPLRSPSFFDLYLDTRPNDRVRAFAKFRMTYDFTVSSNDTDFTGAPIENPRFLLDQLWLKFDVARTLFVTVGKERLRWGSGRIWNPTDFVNTSVLDPLAFLDLRLGVPLLKIHLPIESLGWNFYAVALVEGANRVDEVGAAVRGEFVFDLTEFSLSAAVRKDQPVRLGADVNTGVWWFDLKAELGLIYNDKRIYYSGRVDLDTFEFPTDVDRRDDFIPQLVLGAEIQIPYSDQDNITFAAEYFYNGAGFEDASLYIIPLAEQAGLFTPGAVGFNPLYLARHYAALSVILFNPGPWNDTTLFVSGVMSIDDRTLTVRLNHSVQLLTYLQLSTFVQAFLGPTGGALAYGLDIDPTIGLPDGISIPAPLLFVGASLSVDL